MYSSGYGDAYSVGTLSGRFGEIRADPLQDHIFPHRLACFAGKQTDHVLLLGVSGVDALHRAGTAPWTWLEAKDSWSSVGGVCQCWWVGLLMVIWQWIPLLPCSS